MSGYDRGDYHYDNLVAEYLVMDEEFKCAMHVKDCWSSSLAGFQLATCCFAELLTNGIFWLARSCDNLGCHCTMCNLSWMARKKLFLRMREKE